MVLKFLILFFVRLVFGLQNFISTQFLQILVQVLTNFMKVILSLSSPMQMNLQGWVDCFGCIFKCCGKLLDLKA
jgi:hypothetical protein